MQPYTPRTFRRGTRTEVANNLGEETDLRWDGWLPDDGTPYVPPPSFNEAELEELRAAFGPFGYLWMPAPSGGDDTAAILALLTQAQLAGKGVAFRSGSYRLFTQEIVWPSNIPLIGMGKARTTFICDPDGSLRFGVLDGSGAGKFHVGGFTIHGVGAALSPLRVGHISNSKFFDIRVQNCAAAAPAILVETAQNTQWDNLEVVNNGGDGIWWDYGVNNHTLINPIVSNNGGRGHVFTATGPAPAGTSAVDNPRNVHVFGGLCENNDDGEIFIDSGLGLEWIGAQITGSGANPAVHLATGGITLTQVNIIGGQLKASNVLARVDAGTLLIDGGVTLRTATTGVEVGDGGHLVWGQTKNESVGVDYAAIGTAPLRSLVERIATRRTAQATANMVINNTATLANVPGVARVLEPHAEYEFDLFLVATGDSTADLKIGWTLPAGGTMSWVSGSLAAATSSSSASVLLSAQSQSTTPTVGVIGSNTVARATGTVVTGATGGALQLQAAQAVATAADVTVLAATRLSLTRVL